MSSRVNAYGYLLKNNSAKVSDGELFELSIDEKIKRIRICRTKMSESNYIIASMESSDVPIQPVILVKSLHETCSQFAATTLTALIDTVGGSFTVNSDKS